MKSKAKTQALKAALIKSSQAQYQIIHSRYQRLKTKALPDNKLFHFLIESYLLNLISLKSLTTCANILESKTKVQAILEINNQLLTQLSTKDQVSILKLQNKFLKNCIKNILSYQNHEEIEKSKRILNKYL